MTASQPAPLDDAERRRRRRELLDAVRDGAALRARLTPRAAARDRARELVHHRTVRG